MEASQKKFAVIAGISSVILALALKPLWSQENNPANGMSKQSQNAANAIVSLIVHHEANQDFPARPRNDTEAFAETRYTPDSWRRPYRLRRYSRASEVVLMSYGRDGKLGGSGAKTDWIYELSMETNALACISILSSPDPQLARDTLLDTCKRWHELFKKQRTFQVNVLPEDIQKEKLKNYELTKQLDEQPVPTQLVNHAVFDFCEILSIITLILILWVWAIAVFKNKTRCLIVVALLSFVMSCMFYISGIDEGHLLFPLLGIVAFIVKKNDNKNYRWYLAFLLYTIGMNLFFAILI
jgi:hypothetical protein